MSLDRRQDGILAVNFLAAAMDNPFFAASGTFGYGDDYGFAFDSHLLGGIISKGLTLNAKSGNPGIRIWENPSGSLLNSIGLQNPGVPAFISEYLPEMKKRNNVVAVNLGGDDLDEYVEGAKLLDSVDFDILELNISCPNVKGGGMAFGIKPGDVKTVVGAVRAATRHKLMVKLTPNAENVADTARAAEEAGADAVSLINTIQAMAIDIRSRRPVFDNTYAGLSGPAVFPIALRMVHQVAKAVSIPVCGVGGVSTWEDAIAMFMAGASTVQVGSAFFMDPHAAQEIIKGVSEFLLSEGVQNVSEIVGVA